MQIKVLLTLITSLSLSACIEVAQPVDVNPNKDHGELLDQDSTHSGNDQSDTGSGSNTDTDSDTSSNTDTDSDTSSNTDTDSDTDSNTNSGTDSDTGSNTDTDSPIESPVNLSHFTYPLSNHVITEKSLTFTFTDKGRMWLDLGSVKNGEEIVNTAITGNQFTVNDLPDNLTQLHATLWTFTDNEWKNSTYQWAVNFSNDNTDVENDSPETGKTLWETTCSNSSCHSAGAINGVFTLSSLDTKGIYNTDQLSNYINQYMPLLNPEECSSNCAKDVATYISTWHAFPEDTNDEDTSTGSPRNPVVAEQCSTETSVGYQTIRLLTRDQYQRSVEDLLNVNFDVRAQLPVDLKSGTFTNNNQLSVLDSAYVSYMAVADEIAKWSADNNFSGYLQCSSFNQSCATNFIDNQAWKIIRRPFNSEERAQFLSMASGDLTEGNVKDGIELTLSALLSSPQFVYRHEIGQPASGLGNGVYELTQYELATFISYAFSGTTPDDTLLNAARNNQLSSSAQLEAHVSRLLDSSEAISIVEDLVHKWLKTDLILTQQKDSDLFGDFKQIAPHMMSELSKTFSHVMLDKNEKYESLYDANYAFINQPLAQHYNLNGATGNTLQKIYNNERGGILLSGAFLSRWAHPDETNAITRAAHVRRDMLCQDIPNPPSGVSLSLKDKEGELADFLAASTTTQRMRYHSTTDFGSCTACHSEIINPLGFGLEDFNAVGVKRDQDHNGNNIDASGALWSPFLQLQFYDDPNRVKEMVEFTGGKGLGKLLAHDPQISSLAKSCLAKQMLSHVSGVDTRALSESDREDVTALSETEKNAYTCDVMDLVDTLSNESPRRMLEKIGGLESIRFRKAWSR